MLFTLSTWLASGQLPIGWTAGSAVFAGVVAIGATFLFPGLELPRWAKVALVISALALTSLPGTGVSGPQRVGLQWWGADAGMLMVMLVVIATGSRAWTWLAYCGYLTGIAIVAIEVTAAEATNDATQVLLAVVIIESGAIFGFWKLRQLIERLALQATAQRAETAIVRSRTLAAHERDRVRRLWLESALAPTRDLLTAIATGILDPRDPATRSRCGRQETLLRSLIQIDPETGQLGDALIRVISWAATQRTEVQVRFVATAAPPSQTQLAQIEVALRGVLAAAPGDHPAVITLGSSGHDDGWLLVIFPAPPLLAGDNCVSGQAVRPAGSEATDAEERGGPIDVAWSQDDDQVMVEISWQTPQPPTTGELADESWELDVDADEPGRSGLCLPASSTADDRVGLRT